MNKEWANRFRLSETYQTLSENPVAYFCMEYALPDNLPIYAGGLGVLAGDYVTEAKENDFPMVAMGLFYSKKCHINTNGNTYITNNPAYLDLKPVLDKFGKRIKITIPMADRIVYVQAWLYEGGTIPVYLLDSNLGENDLSDRSITDLLYVFDSERRLKQEMILGVGGVRFLETLGIKPSIYHMNEGHSAFLIYELSKIIMLEDEISFTEAFNNARTKIAFTNHTLVPGARDSFSYELASRVLTSYSDEIGVPVEELIFKGLDNEKKNISATNLAFKAADKINAVSVLHSEKAKNVWPDIPMFPITNGVSIKRWDKIGDSSIFLEKHQASKRKLLARIKKQTKVKWGENELLVGWARRITGYKRPVGIFDELEKIKNMVKNEKTPLRLVFAGYPHYLDDEGQWLLNRLRDLAKKDLKGNLVYLEKYTTEISEEMVSGCDVWLNTPIVGLEACGTSTMKAALNGTLLCSTNDGWIPEVDLNNIGFMLTNEFLSANFVDTFQSTVIPLYYQARDNNSLWRKKMLDSRKAIIENFGADRMLKDYIEKVYEPILSNNICSKSDS